MALHPENIEVEKDFFERDILKCCKQYIQLSRFTKQIERLLSFQPPISKDKTEYLE